MGKINFVGQNFRAKRENRHKLRHHPDRRIGTSAEVTLADEKLARVSMSVVEQRSTMTCPNPYQHILSDVFLVSLSDE